VNDRRVYVSRLYALKKQIRDFEEWAKSEGFDVSIQIVAHGDHTKVPAVNTDVITITHVEHAERAK
jgi:hypothetical protein